MERVEVGVVEGSSSRVEVEVVGSPLLRTNSNHSTNSSSNHNSSSSIVDLLTRRTGAEGEGEAEGVVVVVAVEEGVVGDRAKSEAEMTVEVVEGVVVVVEVVVVEVVVVVIEEGEEVGVEAADQHNT